MKYVLVTGFFLLFAVAMVQSTSFEPPITRYEINGTTYYYDSNGTEVQEQDYVLFIADRVWMHRDDYIATRNKVTELNQTVEALRQAGIQQKQRIDILCAEAGGIC